MKGSFGSVILTWQIYLVDVQTNTLTPAIPQQDFDIVSGTIEFHDSDLIGVIDLEIIDDDIPELEKTYRVILINATGGGNIGSVMSAEVCISESDDPYGLFSFKDDSLGEVWIAEDIPVNEGSNDTVIFNVIRTAGTFGMISVSNT